MRSPATNDTSSKDDSRPTLPGGIQRPAMPTTVPGDGDRPLMNRNTPVAKPVQPGGTAPAPGVTSNDPVGGPAPDVGAPAYAGFMVNGSAPDDQVVSIGGQNYSLGFVRDAVNTLNETRPYNGPVTADFQTLDWGQGSGTGVNLITNYLSEVAPNGEPDLSSGIAPAPTVTPNDPISGPAPGANVPRYAGFTVNGSAPDDQVVTVDNQEYTLGFIRDAVNTLSATQPYNGLVTTDFQTLDWGQGSGTGLNLIREYLAIVNPNGASGDV